MTTLLLLDLLGSRDRWRHGGPALVERVFDHFHHLVCDAARGLDAAAELRGDLEGDRAAIWCPNAEVALALGRRLFRRVFLEPRSPDDLRLWVRGVVCDASGGNGDTARTMEETAPSELPGLRRHVFGPGMQDALSVLYSGFQGMRLLVANSLLHDTLRGRFRIPVGRLGVIPFRKLNHSPYPSSIHRNFQDCLWMAETQQEWGSYESRMTMRMLWSARNPQEFSQAAATQGVFHETLLILKSVARKASWQDGEVEIDASDEAAPTGPSEGYERDT